MKIANFERLIVLPLTKKENKSYYNKNIIIYVKINLILKYTEKFKIIIVLLENIGILHILYAI